MAQKRMLDKSFLSQKQFLTLPSSAKILYVYGNIFADNDGFVEMFPLVSMVSASEDDVKILEAKGFVATLNEDWICFLPHWWDNQASSFNRWTPSIYRNLLWNIRPELGNRLREVSEIQLSKIKQTVSLSYSGRRPDIVPTLSVPIESNLIESNRNEKNESMIQDENVETLFLYFEQNFGVLLPQQKTQLREWCDRYSINRIKKIIEKAVDYTAINPIGYIKKIIDTGNL
ncbi:hypothetical protein [Lactococcus lactis]|uniref:Uncharacterized protein n=1 Tax=Lactococcus lactis TaxID=1358 RepID=A0AAP3Z2T9_9LACT|nr:hypothetical protein [Lactococcus lactis]MDG4977304.1 hypothetical protein [Lactococcus lactis]